MNNREAAAFAMVDASKKMLTDAGVDRVGFTFEEIDYVSENRIIRFHEGARNCKVGLSEEVNTGVQRALWEIMDQNNTIVLAYCALLDGDESIAHSVDPASNEIRDVDELEVEEACKVLLSKALKNHLQAQDKRLQVAKNTLTNFIEQYKVENDIPSRQSIDGIFNAYITDEGVSLKLIVYQTDDGESFVDLIAEKETTKDTFSVVLSDDDNELTHTLHINDKQEVADRNVSYDANMVGEYERFLRLLLKQQV